MWGRLTEIIQAGNKAEIRMENQEKYIWDLGTLSNDLISTEGVLEREETENRQKEYLER